MTGSELIAAMKTEFEGRGRAKGRKFSAGLLVAFIRFFRKLDAVPQVFQTFNEFLEHHPQVLQTRSGDKAASLIVRSNHADPTRRTVNIREFYDEIERFFRSEAMRFDYPNAAPHATGTWRDYVTWIDAVLRLTEQELRLVEKATIDFVLEKLPSHELGDGEIPPIRRRFTRLLTQFDMAVHSGEPKGAAFQGLIYAFIRADSPHLHIDVAKVGAGSSRLQRVGDVDGWMGERLVLSAEVKHVHIDDEATEGLIAFQGKVSRRGALGIVAANSFAETARIRLAKLSLRLIDLDELVKRVDLWDPIKQDAAVDAFSYYVCHIEKRMPLIQRLRDFLADGGN